MNSGERDLVNGEREAQGDKLFGKWKRALDLPPSFPQPVPPPHVSANRLLGSEYRADHSVSHLGLGSINLIRTIAHYSTNYSFIVTPSGQGSTTLAEVADASDAASMGNINYIPVLVKPDITKGAASNQELKSKVLEEIAKRALLAQCQDRKVRLELRGLGVINEDFEVDFVLAMEHFGTIKNIFDGMSKNTMGFVVRVDFSSDLSRENAVKYGLEVGRLFLAVNGVIEDLRERNVVPDRLMMQGFGPINSLEAISEISDVKFGVVNEGDEISVFEAWRMLLKSYPDQADDIARYIHSGLLGKAVASGEQLPIREIFKRFEENLKAELEKDPNSLHLGFK